MQTMKFSEKQEKVTIYELDNDTRDVAICLNEREVTGTEENQNEDESEKKETTMYEYDGNIFRTHAISADDIVSDPESYIDYPGDEPPTDAMVEYANQKIDEYTAQLMEEGLI